jgi:hypothetical protein
MNKLSMAFALAVAGLATTASAADVLIRNAEVHTLASAGKLANADVLVRGGKIAAVGRGLSAPSGATVVEANGKPLTPGLFAGLTAIGLEEVPGESSTVDEFLKLNAPQHEMQWRPEFDVTLAYNPRSVLVPVAQVEGLTWTVIQPGATAGGSILSGQGAAVVLDGRFDAVLEGSHSMFVWFGSDVLSLSGGSSASDRCCCRAAAKCWRVISRAVDSCSAPIGRPISDKCWRLRSVTASSP